MKQTVGGQAVIEGVMMKSKEKIAIAVRKGKKIIIKQEPYVSYSEKNAFLKLPFVRGVVNLFEMLVIGMRALSWSANQQAEEGQELGTAEMTITLLISLVAVILLFIVAPYFFSRMFAESATFLFNLIDSLFRLAIFLLYLYAIGRMKDIKSVFQYHGAEHKAVHCYEEGKKLTVENVETFSTAHARCGTTLLVFVIALSILLFSFVRSQFWYYNIAFRIILIPVIAGIAYEWLRIGAKMSKYAIVRAMVAPGLWVQSMTTREPTKGQIEVAIVALKKVI